MNFCPPVKVPSYLVNKEQRRLFAQKSAGWGGLYLRESSESAGDLLLLEERAVYTVLRFTLCLRQPLPFSRLPVYSDLFSSLTFTCFLSISIRSFLSLLAGSPSSPPRTSLTDFSLRPPVFPWSLALFEWSLSLDSPGCIQVKLLIASAVGGLRRWLTTAQPVPVQGAAG